MSILLSDGNSPFICLVAVDSRIAVKCIEGEMGSTLLKANVNGHEYMRKIINLPFCIPEVIFYFLVNSMFELQIYHEKV